MMPSPFPGMDPYLEQADLWPDVHHRLMDEISYMLIALIAPKYTARLSTQIVIDRVQMTGGRTTMTPDVSVSEQPGSSGAFRQSALGLAVAPVTLHTTSPIELRVPFRQVTVEIITAPEEELVTIIELLSPVNKRQSDPRYTRKRTRILRTDVHLLELDLLRAGERIKVNDPLPDAAYFAFLSRGDARPACEVRAIQITEPLPVVPVPLLEDDPDVPLDLNAALTTIYDRAQYRQRIDYTADPVPPLSDEDAAWVDALLREKGLRS